MLRVSSFLKRSQQQLNKELFSALSKEKENGNELTKREAYEILKVSEKASLQHVYFSYTKYAQVFHPSLNPKINVVFPKNDPVYSSEVME